MKNIKIGMRERKNKMIIFLKMYNNFFKNKLEYIENIFLIENTKKVFFAFSKIINHKVF